jgi:hypothetical protein
MSHIHPKPNLVELEELSGPAPVLRTEDREVYEKIRADFMARFVPQDVLAWQLVNRLIDDAWLIKRYGRHQTVAVERWYHQGLEFQVQRAKLQNARKVALTSRLAEKVTQSPPEVAHLVYLEDKVVELVSDCDEILQRTPTELQHNRALEKSIVFQEQLDKLVTSATKRFNETLELLENYQEGLGQRLRQAADELVDPNGVEQGNNPLPQIEAPSVVPSDVNAVEIKEVDQTPKSTTGSK